MAKSWNQRNYHCLIQDVRGRYRSDGLWEPYSHEADDGRDLLSQLATENPCLPVLAYGASYAAHTALEATRSAAEAGVTVAAVIVVVPALGRAETATASSGEPHIRHRIGWWHEHGRARHALQPLSHAELDRRTAQASEIGVISAAQNWGWSPHALAGWRQLWEAERLDLPARYGDLAMPLLTISGKDDFFDEDAHRLTRVWRGQSHIVTGPWGHTLPGGIPDPRLRHRIQSAGGLSSVIDPWLAAHGLPGTEANWAAILAGTSHTCSTFDPATGAWHHEGTTL